MTSIHAPMTFSEGCDCMIMKYFNYSCLSFPIIALGFTFGLTCS